MDSNNFPSLSAATSHTTSSKAIYINVSDPLAVTTKYLDFCFCRCYFAADYAHNLNLHEYYSHNPVPAIQQSFNPHLERNIKLNSYTSGEFKTLASAQLNVCDGDLGL